MPTPDELEVILEAEARINAQREMEAEAAEKVRTAKRNQRPKMLRDQYATHAIAGLTLDLTPEGYSVQGWLPNGAVVDITRQRQDGKMVITAGKPLSLDNFKLVTENLLPLLQKRNSRIQRNIGKI